MQSWPQEFLDACIFKEVQNIGGGNYYREDLMHNIGYGVQGTINQMTTGNLKTVSYTLNFTGINLNQQIADSNKNQVFSMLFLRLLNALETDGLAQKTARPQQRISKDSDLLDFFNFASLPHNPDSKLIVPTSWYGPLYTKLNLAFSHFVLPFTVSPKKIYTRQMFPFGGTITSAPGGTTKIMAVHSDSAIVVSSPAFSIVGNSISASIDYDIQYITELDLFDC
jgi:hypothetical protein